MTIVTTLSWLGRDTDPENRSWEDLCFDPKCIEKARKIYQPYEQDPKFCLAIQLPTNIRTAIIDKHCVKEGFNFNDPSFCEKSARNKNSVFTFTSDCLNGFLHTMYGTTISPGNSTLVYNHQYDTTCWQLSDFASVYEVVMHYKSPAA